MASLDTIRRVVVQVTGAEGVERLAAASEKLAAAEQNLASGATAAAGATERKAITTDTATRREVDLASAIDRHRRSLDTTFAAQMRYERVQRDINMAALQGVTGLERLSELNRARYVQALNNIAGAGKATDATTQQIVGLQYQLNDVALSLASGQSPFMVLMQQGMQVSQMFGPGTSLRSAGATIAAGFASMLSPINLTVVGLAAAAGAASLLFSTIADESESSEDALQRHADLIRSFRDAYGDAAESLRDYSQATQSVLSTQIRGGLFEEQARYDLLVPDVLGELGMRSRDRFSPHSAFAVFREEIEAAGKLALEGKPAFLELYDAVAGRANAEPGNSELTRVALDLFTVIEGAREAEARLRSLRDAQRLAIPSDDRRESIIDRYQSQRSANQAAGFGIPLPSPSPLRSLAEDPFPRQTELFRDSRSALEEQAAALEMQAFAFGKSAGEVARAEELQRLLTEAQRRNLEVTHPLLEQFRQMADAVGRMAQAAADLTERQEELVGAMDALRSASSSTFGGIAKDLMSGKDGAEALRNALGEAAERTLDHGIAAGVEGLFGRRGQPGGGLFGDELGGFLGNILGVPQAQDAASAAVEAARGLAIGTATITAGSVTVLGYAPTDGGIAFPPFGDAAGMPSAAAPGVPSGVVGDSLVPRTFTMPGGAALPSSIVGPGGDVSYGQNWNGAVDPRLLDILQQAAAGSPYDVRFTSGLRPGDKRFHGRGLATDVGLVDPITGQMLDNYQDPSTFRAYEEFAQRARLIQMEQYPDLAEEFRWGGYFSGPKGNYGALDSMHFDLGGGRVGMGGGSWEHGLTEAQRRLWPGAQSIGMGADPSVAMAEAAAAAQTATRSFGELGGALGAATPQAGALGQAIAGAFSTPAVPGAGSGGGLFDFFGSLFSPAPIPAMAGGGGPVRGPGTETSDSILAMLSDGEFVVNAKATREHRGLLEAINRGMIVGYAEGGRVGRIPGYALETMRGSRGGWGGGEGGGRPMVVIEDKRGRGAPKVEQKRERGPSGEEVLRFTIRDEIGKSYRPGGLADKDLRSRGSPRPPIER
jgi:hypothetical protein